MALIPFGILSAAAGGALRVAVAGYVAGSGTTVDKFAFPSDSRTTLGTGLSSGRETHGFADSGVAGYSAGGGGQNTVDKFAFPADTRTTLGTGLSSVLTDGGSMSNSGVAGYVTWGYTTGFTFLTTINKFTFPGDSRSTLAATLSPERRGIHGFANYGTSGYFAGGQRDGIIGGYTTINKLAFPADTISTLASGISTIRSWPAAFGSHAVAGYVAGGYQETPGNARVATVDKFAFPSDTRTTLGTGLSGIRGNMTGYCNSGVAGYFAGGFDDSVALSTVDKFELPSDTRTTLGTGLSSARFSYGGFSNEGAF